MVEPMGDAQSKVLSKGSWFATTLDATAPRKFWFPVWFALLPYVLIRAENLAESDTFWQIRTGLLTIAQGRLPAVDPFSWTAAGRPWTLNSWGFNVVLGWAYEAAGLVGVALISACLVAAVGGLVLYLARQLGSAPLPSACVLLLGMPLLTLYLSARPQLVDYIAVLGLIIFLRRLVDGHKPVWSLGAICVMTVLWVNLHAAALLGMAVVGASVLAVVFGRTTRRRAGWLLTALLVVVLSSLVNPYGINLFSQTMQVRAESTVVIEWQPFNPADPLQLALFAVGLLGLGVAVWRRDPIFAAALTVSACGSIAAMRILPIFVLLALPVLASVMSRGVVIRFLASRQRMLARGGGVLLAVVFGLALYNLPSFGRPDPARFPELAIKAIPAGCKVFNEYHLGGLVILQRPDVKVSMDSRNDLYGAELVRESWQVVRGKVDPSEGLAGADCVLVRPTSGLAGQLRTSPEWDMTAAESAGVLFVRR